MPYRFRVGSFNCENLFSRARLLNFDDNAQARPLLDSVEKLLVELGKKKYDPAKILEHYRPVAKYLIVRENRGKLFKGRGSRFSVAAKGVQDWSGSVEFRRDTIWPEAQENTARIVKTVGAEILCVVEVEDRPELARFGRMPLLKNDGYRHAMLVDGNDPRGIDVGLMSRLPIQELRSHVDDEDDRGRIFSRDCLEARVTLGNGQGLRLLINHFKSQGYGSKATNDAKRLRQATRVAQILQDRYDLTRDLVVVAGDFNDKPGNPPLAPLLSLPHLHNVLAEDRPGDSWTYAYRGKKDQIDYLLVSEPLRQSLTKVGVERRGMFDVEKLTGGNIKRLPTITTYKESASDHAAVYADFKLV